jgi:hypothetical protein
LEKALNNLGFSHDGKGYGFPMKWITAK